MTTKESNFGHDAPGGLLILADNGSIVEAPEFFRRALLLDERNAPSIYHLCDPFDPPYLLLNRIFRHSYGGTEYHLRIHGHFNDRYGFRYWPLKSPPGLELEPNHNAFFIVDDSTILQTQEWDVRRLRRQILTDVKQSLSSHFQNRLATLQLLSETLRDAPEFAEETAPRLLRGVNELHAALNEVVTGVGRVESDTAYEDSPVRLGDLWPVITAWAKGKVSIECILRDVAPTTLIPASSIERILLPVVENAIEASLPGSTVGVVISETDDGFAYFEVVDKGEGMNERVKARAQDPCFTTRNGHLGLGLTHAREALREAGGQWQFDSQARKGTRVTLLLPVTTTSEIFADS